MVEEYLLPPQQKLKLALYRGRKLLAAKEADGAVREFVRAQALARIVHGDQHWRYCRCKVFLAQAYLYLKVRPIRNYYGFTIYLLCYKVCLVYFEDHILYICHPMNV